MLTTIIICNIASTCMGPLKSFVASCRVAKMVNEPLDETVSNEFFNLLEITRLNCVIKAFYSNFEEWTISILTL